MRGIVFDDAQGILGRGGGMTKKNEGEGGIWKMNLSWSQK